MKTVKVGFIGLGIMGKPMSMNLLKAGYPLHVYNRSRGAAEELVSMGAVAAYSSEEVARKSDVVITMLPDSPDVESVILGPKGILQGARSGLTVIDMSTISPETIRFIAGKLMEKGVFLLDAPVSGGDKGAIEGTLSIMVGGDKEIFEKHLDILRVLGKNIVYMGGNGNGQLTKLCNQIIVALNMLAVSEGLIFGAKAGLNLEDLLKAISSGAAQSWSLNNLGPKILKRDFRPGFKIRLQQKDLRLALDMAKSMNLPLPATSLVNQLFRSAEARGLGDEGTQALIKVIEDLAHFEVASN